MDLRWCSQACALASFGDVLEMAVKLRQVVGVSSPNQVHPTERDPENPMEQHSCMH